MAVILGVLMLAFGSCQVVGASLSVPAQVSVGEVFPIDISAAIWGSTGVTIAALQLPPGFVIEDWEVQFTGNGTAPVSMDPLGQYNQQVSLVVPPEPQHTLTTFSGDGTYGGSHNQVGAYVRVFARAPQQPGNYALKVAFGEFLAGYQQHLPAGASSFAAITTAPFSSPIQVVAAVSPGPYVLDNDGRWSTAVNSAEQKRSTLHDLDGDGVDELLVLSGSSLRVWRRSAGAWVAQPPVLSPVYDYAVGDLDDDGLADIVDNWGRVHYGNPGNVWVAGPTFAHGLNSPSVAFGDVDGDSDLDIVFADSSGYHVQRNDGASGFVNASAGLPTSASAFPSESLQVVDLDGDGAAEIVTTSRAAISTAASLSVWAFTGTAWQLTGQIGGWWPKVVAIDIDGDDLPELVPSSGTAAYRYVNQALVAFPRPFALYWRGVAEDYDGDGDEDLLAWVFGSNLGIYRNEGNGTFSGPHPILVGAANNAFTQGTRDIASGDFDGDGAPDLVILQSYFGPFGPQSSFGAQACRNVVRGARGYGEGCAGTGVAAPELNVVGTIASGQPVTLQVTNARPSGAALVWFGYSRLSWFGQLPLPLSLATVGAPGCTLLAEPVAIALLYTDAAGAGTLATSLPNVAASVRMVMFGQAASVSPGANALGLTFSAGVAVRLQ